MPRNAPEQLVSVIIPAYNAERFLGEAIVSVLAQTYRPIELIVVDDGSTDRTGEIARSYDRVIYIHQPNAGTASARNHGIRDSRGEYLAFLDADDLWLPAKLTLQMKSFADDEQLEIVSGYVEQFVSPADTSRDSGRYIFSSDPLPGYSSNAILIKRSAIERLGMFHEDYQSAESISWFAEILTKHPNLLMLPDVVTRRRIHGENVSLKMQQVKNREMLRILKRSIDQKRAKGSGPD